MTYRQPMPGQHSRHPVADHRMSVSCQRDDTDEMLWMLRFGGAAFSWSGPSCLTDGCKKLQDVGLHPARTLLWLDVAVAKVPQAFTGIVSKCQSSCIRRHLASLPAYSRLPCFGDGPACTSGHAFTHWPATIDATSAPTTAAATASSNTIKL